MNATVSGKLAQREVLGGIGQAEKRVKGAEVL